MEQASVITTQPLRTVNQMCAQTLIFQSIDTDGSKTLSKEELAASTFGKHYVDVLGMLDSDGDGSVSIEEWNDFWVRLQEEKGADFVSEMIVRTLYVADVDVTDYIPDDIDEEELEEDIKEYYKNHLSPRRSMCLRRSESEVATRAYWFSGVFASKEEQEAEEAEYATLYQGLADGGKIERVREIFNRWDINKKGFLDLDDIQHVVKEYASVEADADANMEAARLLGLCDTISNGNVDEMEFTRLFLKIAPACASNSAEEFDAAIGTLGAAIEKATSHMVYHNLFRHFDTQDSGKVAKAPLLLACTEYAKISAAESEATTMSDDGGLLSDEVDLAQFIEHIKKVLGVTDAKELSEKALTFATCANRAMKNDRMDELFTAWDADKSGFLEPAEIDIVFRRFDDLGVLYKGDATKVADENDDGKIDRGEFPAYIERLCDGMQTHGFNNSVDYLLKIISDVQKIKAMENLFARYEKDGWLRMEFVHASLTRLLSTSHSELIDIAGCPMKGKIDNGNFAEFMLQQVLKNSTDAAFEKLVKDWKVAADELVEAQKQEETKVEDKGTFERDPESVQAASTPLPVQPNKTAGCCVVQ